jgi:uncharacterized protein YjbJ (UPF0337 family)
MSAKDRAEATAKNIEGKAQEAMGKVTGDQSEQAEGKAKQGEASTKHAVEDGKAILKIKNSLGFILFFVFRYPKV